MSLLDYFENHSNIADTCEEMHGAELPSHVMVCNSQLRQTYWMLHKTYEEH